MKRAAILLGLVVLCALAFGGSSNNSGVRGDANGVVKTLNRLTGNLTLNAVGGATVSSNGDNRITVAAGKAGGYTLGEAYNVGGPGQGRTILANAGPVNVAGSDGLTVAGATHTGDLAVSGTTTTSSLSVAGAATVGHLTVEMSTTTGGLNVSGTATAGDLHVSGTTTTGVLTISGGADIAEPFSISDSRRVEKGSVLIIDDAHPGQLRLSVTAYDHRVAGVASGAGGINSGLTLGQSQKLGAGLEVAVSGRVYCLATTRNGQIRPGDMLTTSEVAGHAMRATSFEMSQGAILGKALSSLPEGQGLVLVLVSLQ